MAKDSKRAMSQEKFESRLSRGDFSDNSNYPSGTSLAPYPHISMAKICVLRLKYSICFSNCSSYRFIKEESKDIAFSDISLPAQFISTKSEYKKRH